MVYRYRQASVTSSFYHHLFLRLYLSSPSLSCCCKPFSVLKSAKRQPKMVDERPLCYYVHDSVSKYNRVHKTSDFTTRPFLYIVLFILSKYILYINIYIYIYTYKNIYFGTYTHTVDWHLYCIPMRVRADNKFLTYMHQYTVRSTTTVCVLTIWNKRYCHTISTDLNCGY